MVESYSHQLVAGISFGLSSGVITALGMIVGLDSATSSKLVVIAGLIVMAVADGLADAIGMHVAEESEICEGNSVHTSKEIWITTICTFFSVGGIIITFTIPIFLLPLTTAILVGIVWGMGLLIVFNLYIARIRNENPLKIILEHIVLAVCVIIISYLIGQAVANLGI